MVAFDARRPRASGLRIYECRWSWCRAVFRNNQERIQHLREHAAKSLPVRRGDIQLLRLAEDGVGESMRLFEMERSQELVPAPESPITQSPFLSRLSRSVSPGFNEDVHQSNSPGLEHDPSNALSLDHEDPMTEILLGSRLEGTPRNSRVRGRTPTFTSLSSPACDGSFTPLPDSPSFDSLVSDATRSRLHKVWKPLNSPFRASTSSRSSSGSASFVEKQLTQTPSPHSEERRSEGRPTTEQSSIVPNGKHRSSPLFIPTVETPKAKPHAPLVKPALAPNDGVSSRHQSVVRQAWYGTLPVRRKSQTHHRRRSRSGTFTSPDSPQSVNPKRTIIQSMQSDTLPSVATDSPQHREVMPANNAKTLNDPYSQWTESYSSEDYDSLALLQTQAPYQSQTQVPLD